MPVPVTQPSAGHGLRTAVIWILLLLALAALIAALVVHLSQIQAGAALSTGTLVASAGRLAACLPRIGV